MASSDKRRVYFWGGVKGTKGENFSFKKAAFLQTEN